MNENKIERRPVKQEGYGWGTPCLVVDDGDDAIEAYTQVFWFRLDNCMRDEHGKVSFAKLSYKDFGLHICDVNSSCCGVQGCKTPRGMGVMSPVSLYLYIDDVDAVVERARERGLKVLQEVKVMFWGDEMCTVEDASGYIWNFARNVADFDASKKPSNC